MDGERLVELAGGELLRGLRELEHRRGEPLPEGMADHDADRRKSDRQQQEDQHAGFEDVTRLIERVANHEIPDHRVRSVADRGDCDQHSTDLPNAVRPLVLQFIGRWGRFAHCDERRVVGSNDHGEADLADPEEPRETLADRGRRVEVETGRRVVGGYLSEGEERPPGLVERDRAELKAGRDAEEHAGPRRHAADRQEKPDPDGPLAILVHWFQRLAFLRLANTGSFPAGIDPGGNLCFHRLAISQRPWET